MSESPPPLVQLLRTIEVASAIRRGVLVGAGLVFFLKQKTAYELSECDWSSDVCSSDLEAQGFEIDGIMQEGGAGQIELNMRHGDPVRLADEVFFFKRLIREAALRHDCYATFMAKPIQDEPGSAMHIHHSVVESA